MTLWHTTTSTLAPPNGSPADRSGPHEARADARPPRGFQAGDGQVDTDQASAGPAKFQRHEGTAGAAHKAFSSARPTARRALKRPPHFGVLPLSNTEEEQAHQPGKVVSMSQGRDAADDFFLAERKGHGV
jgi:hypothetical protein